MDLHGSLDAFLRHPGSQRPLTALVRRALFHQTYGVFAVVGPGDAAAALVAALHRVHPDAQGHRFLIQTRPTRLTVGTDADVRPLEMPPTEVVRALLRQDPDGFAVDRVEAGVGSMLVQAALTGHQVVVGVDGRGTPSVVEALLAGSDGSLPAAMLEDQVVGWVVELAPEPAATAPIQRILRRVNGAWVEVGTATDTGCTVRHADLPWAQEPNTAPATAAAATPRLAPPLTSRSPARHAGRAAYVTRTGTPAPGTASPHRIHAVQVLWPKGEPWPHCRACHAPLRHVVQLDLQRLPDSPVAQAGVVQLFVCAAGCDTTSETAPGVHVRTVDAAACEERAAPVPPDPEVLAPGDVVGWDRVEEEPDPEDARALGLAGTDDDDDGNHAGDDGGDGDQRGPLACDKVGGWPAWQQGAEWPGPKEDAFLLFQWVEGAPEVGSAPPQFDEATGGLTAAVPAVRVLDPNLPRRFRWLTGDASAFLFLELSTGRLTFRWQAG